MTFETNNIERLIQDHSEIMAEQMPKIADWAGSEEDVRYECNKLIDEFLKKAGIKLKGQHEYGLAGGRIDSKYGGVIIEYKNPKGAGKITDDLTSSGTKAVVEQIKKRYEDFKKEEKIEPDRLFAVGCDANFLVFVRYRELEFEVESPQLVTQHTVQRLLRALVSLGAKGKSFTPDYLVDDFGAESSLAQKDIHQIYKVITETESSKAKIFFSQWKILFGEVCGYDVEGKNKKIKELAKHYGFPGGAEPAELLFSVHSYYAIFIKFLAAEIASSFSPIGVSTIKKCVSAPTPAKLRREMQYIEHGGIWSQMGISNFLEGDIFSWYLDAWDDRMAEVVWGILRTLDQYDPTTLSVEPSESRDLLKQLYQHLFPKSVRHDLGEYYTPDWLADYVLDELDYNGDPGKRLLDPACGSGTFLVMAINRIKGWFEEHRHECGFGEDELIKRILKNIIGFDLNPLAVMAARTNYLLAIRDLLKFTSGVELPVYLCDSVLTPAEYGDLFTGSSGNVRRLKTSAGEFLIPNEICVKREEMGKYADSLEFCIRHKYETDEFISSCMDDDLPIEQEKLHRELYETLKELEAKSQNGIWARIIKNAFAPLFIDPVDYVAGNPPWVTWINLPQDYRDETKALWIDRYGLMSSGVSLMSNLGQVCKDLSMLFTVSCLDAFLKPEGRLGFVITQTVFQSPAGYEFRQFKIPDLGPYQIKSVDDLVALNPFDAATNRTATFTASLGKETTYPVSYTVWTPTQLRGSIETQTLESVKRGTTRQQKYAFPSSTDPQSVWIITDEPEYEPRPDQSHLTKKRYKARKSVQSGLEAVYRVSATATGSPDKVAITNVLKGAKRKVPEVQRVIESDLVYPYLRGSDCKLYEAKSSGYFIVPHTAETGMKPISEPEMKKKYRHTYSYI